jgi:hypothetical protein
VAGKGSRVEREGKQERLRSIRARMWSRFPELGLALFVDCRRFAERRTYRQVLEQLLSIKGLSLQRIKEMRQVFHPEGITVGIRHDIDYDVVTALSLAKIEHALGVKGSYYVLHTAPYYGYWKDEQFFHSQRCVDVLGEIQSLGHEVGFHNDCLHDLIQWGRPVEDTLRSELSFLRTHGLHIYGTSSHGSYHNHQAANYEIFKEMSIQGRPFFTDKNGKQHRLGFINMKDFDLEYEANFIIKSWMISAEEWSRISCGHKCPSHETDHFIRDYDAQYGIFGKNYWIGQDIKKARRMESGNIPANTVLTTQEVIDKIRSHSPGDKIVLDSHPVYFGHSAQRVMLNRVYRYFARGKEMFAGTVLGKRWLDSAGNG